MDLPERPLLDRLVAYAHAAAHRPGTPCRCAGGLVGVLADRDDGTVVRHGRLVAKAHAPGTDPEAHRARLALAGHPDVRAVLLPPLPAPRPAAAADELDGLLALDGRPVTLWPYGPPVDPADPDAAPWEEAARLLALLHRTPPPVGAADRLPEMRAPVKAALAVDRMRRTAPDHPAAATVLAAWRSVPDRLAPGGPRLLCHGDFHLGQLVRAPGSVPPQKSLSSPPAPWRLIDIDDLGLGDPAWDLARPAAWFAAGILPGDLVPVPRRLPAGGRSRRGRRSLGPTRRARPCADGPDGRPRPRQVDGRAPAARRGGGGDDRHLCAYRRIPNRPGPFGVHVR